MYHLEEAAIGGHPEARHNLGIEERNNGITSREQGNISSSLLISDIMIH
jgi:hypothetical protein